MSLRNLLSAYLMAVVFLLALSVEAQTAATGGLTGVVTDSSGAVLPNVTVTATNTGTGQSRTGATGSDGAYKFTLLPPGAYRVKFQANGFKVVEVPVVTVTVTETPVLNRTLEVGSENQEIQVQAEAETLQTTTSTLGTVLSTETITDLPLTTRNYTNLLGLSAGANSGVFNASTLGKGNTDIAVNGASASQNNVQMDGVSITNNAAAGTISENGLNPGLGIINPDAIQEFKIQTSMFDAGYGRNPGASVNVVTKSGTNAIHGTAFEFFRNTVLNANDWFSNAAGKPRGRLDQNQFGGTVGGPIKKDKLFFFTSYQETRQKNGVAAQGFSVPTLLPIPTGDRSSTSFRSALGATFCPSGTAAGKTSNGGVQVACNGSNINPVALNLLQLKNPDGSYLIPSSTTGRNQNTTFSLPAIFKEHQFLSNIDYVLSPRNTLSGRYFYTADPVNISFSCGSGGGAPGICLPGTAIDEEIKNHYGVAKLTSILSNTLVNEARFSMQRNLFSSGQVSQLTDSQVGIAPIVPQINNLDFITVAGLFTIGSTSNVPSYKWITAWEAADQLSWSHGKHTIRTGFEFERDRYNWQLIGLANGNLTFQTFPDFLLGLPGCAPGTSAAACTASGASGLTNGTFTSNVSSTGSFQAATPANGIVHGYRTPFVDAFVQDDIKINSRVTLNLGLRWEYDGLPYDSQGLASNIWPSRINSVAVPGSTPATGTLAGFVIPSNWDSSLNPAAPVSGVFQSDHKVVTQNNPSKTNFAPRVGFAWQPLASNRLVLRGGGGYFYDRIGQGNFNVPFTQGEPYTTSVFHSGTANWFSTLATPYQNTSLQWTPRWVNINPATQTGTSSNIGQPITEETFRTPVVYEWNLNLQYEVVHNWVMELGYVGSRAIHQPMSREINEAQLASPATPLNGITTNTVANAAVRVPYLGFAPAGLLSYGTDGDSRFNSFQATLRKQFSHGLQFQAAYTLSRSLTTTSFFSDNDPNVPQYGLNPQYRPQRLTINYSWNLPLGKHQGALDKIASGWTLSGVTVVQDGTPLTIIDARGGSIYGFGPGTPVSATAEYCPGMGNGNVASSGSIEQRLGGIAGGSGYFNKSAFCSLPAIGNGTGYGNSGLSTILGPGQSNWDATLQKTTKVGGFREGADLVFRAEFFNLFNHPQFSSPAGAQLDVSKPVFGQITSTSVNPRLIQFALKYVF